MTWLLLKRFWKPLAGLLVLAAVGFWLVNQVHAYGEKRQDAGRSEVQRKWDLAVEARRVQDEEDDKANRRKNAEAETKHAQDLLVIAADRDFARRLLDAAKASRNTAEEAHRVGQADAASRVARSQEEADRAASALTAAVTAYDQACRADAATLEALQAEIRPWVRVE